MPSIEIQYAKEFDDPSVLPTMKPFNNCPYDSEDLIVIVWMETLCFIFENPITTTIVSASTLALIVLALVVAWEVVIDRQADYAALFVSVVQRWGASVADVSDAAGAAGAAGVVLKSL